MASLGGGAVGGKSLVELAEEAKAMAQLMSATACASRHLTGVAPAAAPSKPAKDQRHVTGPFSKSEPRPDTQDAKETTRITEKDDVVPVGAGAEAGDGMSGQLPRHFYITMMAGKEVHASLLSTFPLVLCSNEVRRYLVRSAGLRQADVPLPRTSAAAMAAGTLLARQRRRRHRHYHYIPVHVRSESPANTAVPNESEARRVLSEMSSAERSCTSSSRLLSAEVSRPQLRASHAPGSDSIAGDRSAEVSGSNSSETVTRAPPLYTVTECVTRQANSSNVSASCPSTDLTRSAAFQSVPTLVSPPSQTTQRGHGRGYQSPRRKHLTADAAAREDRLLRASLAVACSRAAGESGLASVGGAIGGGAERNAAAAAATVAAEAELLHRARRIVLPSSSPFMTHYATEVLRLDLGDGNDGGVNSSLTSTVGNGKDGGGRKGDALVLRDATRGNGHHTHPDQNAPLVHLVTPTHTVRSGGGGGGAPHRTPHYGRHQPPPSSPLSSQRSSSSDTSTSRSSSSSSLLTSAEGGMTGQNAVPFGVHRPPAALVKTTNATAVSTKATAEPSPSLPAMACPSSGTPSYLAPQRRQPREDSRRSRGLHFAGSKMKAQLSIVPEERGLPRPRLYAAVNAEALRREDVLRGDLDRLEEKNGQSRRQFALEQAAVNRAVIQAQSAESARVFRRRARMALEMKLNEAERTTTAAAEREKVRNAISAPAVVAAGAATSAASARTPLAAEQITT